MKEKINRNVYQFYKNTLNTHGANAKGVGWNGEDAQRIRYEVLSKIIKDETPFTICDYGCGVGYYYSFLETNYGKILKNYTGYDYLPEALKYAREIYGADDDRRVFVEGTRIKDEFDYIVCSGAFNVKKEETNENWKQYILDILHHFNAYSKRGFAFNALTLYSDADKMKDELYYADQMFLFDYCKRNFSRNVAVLHDYELYDFTILVRK